MEVDYTFVPLSPNSTTCLVFTNQISATPCGWVSDYRHGWEYWHASLYIYLHNSRALTLVNGISSGR